MSTAAATAAPSNTRGKVVLVPFPFDDLSGSKVRPAICLTDPAGPHRHVVIAFIISQPVATPLPTDLVLPPSDVGFATTGLRVASTLRLHRLMTVTTAIIRRELGALTPALQQAVDTRLRLFFGL